jgi:hypothetical protein
MRIQSILESAALVKDGVEDFEMSQIRSVFLERANSRCKRELLAESLAVRKAETKYVP